MNTERPDNDDAEARASGSARGTGGASADGAMKDASKQRPRGGTPASGSAAPEADDGKAPEPPANDTENRRPQAGQPEPEGPDSGDAKTITDAEPEAPSAADAETPASEAASPQADGGKDQPTKSEPPTTHRDQGGEPETEAPERGDAKADATEPPAVEPEDARPPESEPEAPSADDTETPAPEAGATEAADTRADSARAGDSPADGVGGRAPGSGHAEAHRDQGGQPEAGDGGAEVPAGDAGASEPEAAQPDAAQVPVRPASGGGGGRDGDGGGDGRGGAGWRRSPVLVASVAAAVLLVGGGGAYLAASASGGSGGGTTPGVNGDGTPPPLTLDAYAEGGPHGIAPGEPNPYGATYRADGALPDGPGSAPVYRARGQVTEAQVAGLAKALGVDGKPVAEGESWRIGGKDGSGPTLRVDRAAPGTWTFSRYAPGPDACDSKGETCRTPPIGGDRTVTEEAARKAAAPVLKALGQDDAKLDASQVMGVKRVVNAEPEVGGLPTHGWTTGVVVGAGGEVVGGSGRLSTPVKGDTYPVVSAGKALELMNTAPGAGDHAEIGGCASPVPLEGEQQEQSEPCVTATPLPAKDTVTVEKAVFGLASHSVDGQQALVPSWLFEVRPTAAQDGGTVTYPAVDPEYLAPRARSGESGTWSTEPGDGDEPTSAPSTRDVRVEGYTAEGSELTAIFTGGVCADYKATASERGDRVTVTVTETPWPGKVCILIAKQYQQTVRLDAPLAAREVVDADGEPVPLHKDGARLPTAPSGSGGTR